MKYGYEESVVQLGQRLGDLPDLDLLCARTGSVLERTSPPALRLDFLNQRYRIQWPDITFSLDHSNAEVSLKDKVLILHYLMTAAGGPLTGRDITFREVPDGSGYYDVFQKRAINPWLGRYGEDAAGFLQAGEALGGQPAAPGDAALTFQAFARVPVIFVLWRGDDEFPADGSVIFDASVTDYLSAYAITELCELIAWTMVRGAARGQSGGT